MATAYADDVCILIRDQNSISVLQKCLEKLSAASSSEVNWNKSLGLWCGKNSISSPIKTTSLPENLTWRTDGVKYLGSYLGNREMEVKNWEGMLEQVTSRLKKWERLLRSLSYRGRTLVINNLIAAGLWHKAIALQPPRGLIVDIQRVLVKFFWSGYHWLRPAVLYRPRKEGGQGVVDISSRIMAFRLQSVQRLLFNEQIAWHLFAHFLLQQAGGLKYDRHLFLVDLERINYASLPGFYRSLLNAWKGFGVQRLNEVYNCRMFLQEPLFYNTFLLGVPHSQALIKKFIQGQVNKVRDLRDVSRSKWRSARSVADRLGIRSIRLVDQTVRIVVRKFRQLNIGWEGVDIGEDFWMTFPEIKVFSAVQSNTEDLPPFHLVTKTGIQDLSRTKQCCSPSGRTRIALRGEKLGPGSPSAPLWAKLYRLPIHGLLADIQWRLVHWALPSNTFVHHFNSSISITCPFCEQKEDLLHTYVKCERLTPLFSLLIHLFHNLSFSFTSHMFIFGVPYSPSLTDAGAFLNFLVAVAKYTIFSQKVEHCHCFYVQIPVLISLQQNL